MPTGTAVFADTSIIIAKFLREPKMKEIIRQHLSNYHITISSPVVIQEFKRRVINEAVYLMNKLNDDGSSYVMVKRNIINLLGPQWKRKQTICLNLLEEIFTDANDEELTERAKRYLRTLIKHGISLIREDIGHVVSGTNCYLSNYPIIEKIPYKKYDTRTKKCSKVCSLCPVDEFLVENIELCKQILEHLSNSEDLTQELEQTCKFLQEFIANPNTVHQNDPCKTVGDLLIALESHEIPNFYTMNYKESKVLCGILGQNLIVRPHDPNKKEIAYSNDSSP